MNRCVVAGLALAAAACSGAVARANGFYVSGALGADQREQNNSSYNSATDPLGRSIPYPIAEQDQYLMGGEADVAAGYRFDFGRRGAVRVELGFEYDHYRLGDGTYVSHGTKTNDFQFYATETESKGNYLNSYNTTLNAFYDFTQFGAIRPYVGVGAGDHVADISGGQRRRVFTDSVPKSVDANGLPIGPPIYSFTGVSQDNYRSSRSDVGLYLAEVGVSFPVTQRLSFIPAYRYTNEFRGGVPISIVKVGMRYDF